MPQTHDVISAFLDNEPFDARELADALSEPAGRDMLIEFLALRHLVQPDVDAARTIERSRPRSIVRALAAAAAVLVALGAGYVIGEGRSGMAGGPPAPTRVVESAAAWQEVPAGSLP